MSPAQDGYIRFLPRIGTYLQRYRSLLPVFIFFEKCGTHRDFRDCQVKNECVTGFRANKNGWFDEILFD